MDSTIGGKSDNRVTSSGEPTINSGDNLPFTTFLCPTARILSAMKQGQARGDSYELRSSPHSNEITQQDDHILHPCWCNKEDFLEYSGCVCDADKKFGKDDYFCRQCCQRFHKECVESPFEIKHSYHPKHSLKLFYKFNPDPDQHCLHCGKYAYQMLYHCTLCNLYMHPICAKELVSFVLDQPKRHEHPLTFFTRQVSLACNVCGLTNEAHDPTYVCLKCNFVAHKDCAYFPRVIRISFHNHRVSFALSFPPRERSCGVCGKNVDSEYGGYTCNKNEDYVVHSRCALRKDVSDGKELEGVKEEDDIEENVSPFETISEGVILHFSHKHPLGIQTSKVYDRSKICEACIIPIYEGDFYSCRQCRFILHDTCANAPSRKQHVLHPHPLTLKDVTVQDRFADFRCDACKSDCFGFIYYCRKCNFCLDVRCASISIPMDYQGHEHPLSINLSPGEVRTCQACKNVVYDGKALHCINCDFIICFSCVTLPYMARYEHDKHFLTLGFRDDEISKPDWCEVCEKRLPSGQEERLYMCNYGCNTLLHIDCLLGKDRFMKPHLIIYFHRGKIQSLPKYTFSRPICYYCYRRCEDKISFRKHDRIYCSRKEIIAEYRDRERIIIGEEKRREQSVRPRRLLIQL